MRLVFLLPGTPRPHCGTAAREETLVRGLAARGHDVLVVPFFASPSVDSADDETAPPPDDAEDPPTDIYPKTDPADYPAGLDVFAWRDALAPPELVADGDPDLLAPDDDDWVDVACTLFRADDPVERLFLAQHDEAAARHRAPSSADASVDAGTRTGNHAKNKTENADADGGEDTDRDTEGDTETFLVREDALHPASDAPSFAFGPGPQHTMDGGHAAADETRLWPAGPHAPVSGLPSRVPRPADRPRYGPLFFGGLSTWMGRWGVPESWRARARAWMDRPRFTNAFARRFGRVDHCGRGAVAAALLCGVDGPFRAETERLVDYLALQRPAPDAVIFADALLSGPAAALKARMPALRLVCLAQGEQRLLERFREPHRARARRAVRANARLFDRVFTPGQVGAARAMGFLALPARILRTVRPGLDGRRYGPPLRRVRDPFTIGYLSAIEPEKGLDRLAEAFILLSLEKGRDARLWIAGPVRDTRYWNGIRRRLDAAGLADWVTVFGTLDFGGKRDFLRGLSVFSVPSLRPEPRGTVYLEAMAAGVPVAAPSVGVLPELMRRTAGGVLLPPDSPRQLAEAFALMMDDPATADNLGQWARARVLRHYAVDVAAEECEWRLAEMLEERDRPPPDPTEAPCRPT